jgi:hypothetical protein
LVVEALDRQDDIAQDEREIHEAWAWACPNDPPCQHTAYVHDIGERDEPAFRCCIDGCACGAASGLENADGP